MNAPYWLVPIGLFLVLLYILSFIFSRLDILSKAAHRKIWNYALLATFLVTAVLGVLMAVQVNYKLEIPWTEKALKWHVNFGLAMCLIGVFHLLWHGSYYFPRRKRGADAAPASCDDLPESGKGEKEASGAPPLAVFILPLIIGFSGVLVQTLLIRDLLTLFEGNELTISLIVFLWLLLTGAGSLAGSSARLTDRISSPDRIRKASVSVKTLLLLPLLVFPLMFYVKSVMFPPGVETGPAAMAGFLLFVLFPFCFLNGFSFTWTARTLRIEGRTLRAVYGWESIGGAAGGLLCTAAVLFGLPSLTIAILASSGLLFLLAVFQRSGFRAKWLFPAALLVAAVVLQAFDVDRLIVQRFHPNERLVGTAQGSSGRLTVTRAGDQVNIYENGILAHAAGNVILDEELAAFALIQTDRPDRILILGGILSGLPAEAAKFGCRSVDLLESDPHLIGLADNLDLISESPKTRLIRKNPSGWIDSTQDRYDAILVNLPGPLNLNLNRYYTIDFFRRVKKILAPGGVVSAVLPGTANYVSENAAASLGPVVAAARDCFTNARIFPGENSYLVMSDRPLKTGILAELERRGISNTYVNAGYFDENSFRDRMDLIDRAVGAAAVPNSDLKPAAFLNQIRWWLGRFPEKTLLPGSVALVVLILLGVFTGRSGLAGMFVMGAASSGWSVILLLMVQIIGGALYQWTGLFLGMFMVGLAIGSFAGPRILRKGPRPSLGAPLAIFIVLSAAIGVLAPWLVYGRGPVFLKTLILLVAVFVIAASVGACFAVLSIKLETDRGRHDRLYGYDLLGSAVGAIGFPLVVIPLAGLQNALLSLSLTGVLALGIIALGDVRRILSK